MASFIPCTVFQQGIAFGKDIKDIIHRQSIIPGKDIIHRQNISPERNDPPAESCLRKKILALRQISSQPVADFFMPQSQYFLLEPHPVHHMSDPYLTYVVIMRPLYFSRSSCHHRGDYPPPRSILSDSCSGGRKPFRSSW